MQISIQKGDILDETCDLLVVNFFQGIEKPGGATGAVDTALQGDLSALLKQDRFSGKLGEKLCFPTFGRLKAKKVCVLGLGKKADMTADTVRQIGGHIVKAARDAKAKRVITILHGAGMGGVDAELSAQMLGEGLWLASYEFHDHFGAETKKKKSSFPSNILMMESERKHIRPAEKGLERARILAEATVYARDLVNTSPRHMKPFNLMEAAKSVSALSKRIRCTVYDKERMERMGMGAALAVAEGSVNPPQCVHLVYIPKQRSKKKIAVIGKGVTFDSGGLSLKPADGMTTMKIDMAGAASVIGLFRALAEIDVPAEIHGVFIAVENMPSGGSYRPGDVVTAMNGMTIEILNTDAEGRVTMADSLSFAAKRIKPDEIIDLATLTGAAVVALGEDYTGIMSNNRTLVRSLLKASEAAGENMWELPLPELYEEALKSKIADMNNTGGRTAGCIKGGLFLKRFVDGIPWAHLDIAGPSYCEKETRSDTPYGGTGVGVRTLMAYLKSLA